HVPMAVREQLDLDVAWPLEIAFEEDCVVSEGGRGFASRRGDALFELRAAADDAHASSAASSRRLDHQREPELVRLAAGEARHAGLRRGTLGFELVAAPAERVRRRAYENEPSGLDGLGEVGVLGEEPVAGMDRVGCCLLGGADVLLRVEV